jgi:hypothetical protein
VEPVIRDDGFKVDPRAFDILASLFARCGDLGIEVPAEMPLDTPVHQRAAVHYIARLIMAHARELRENLRDE